MARKRGRLAIFLVGAALLLVTACAPDSGTVTKTWGTYNSSTKSVQWWLCVKDASGHEGCQPVSTRAHRHCHRGSKWPDCKQ